MMKKYDDEQTTLSTEITALKLELVDLERNESDIIDWVAKVKQCLSIETLTREMIVELIDSIEVSDVYEVDGKPHQDVSITYRFEDITKGSTGVIEKKASKKKASKKKAS